MRVLSWERREAPSLSRRASYQARAIMASSAAPTASPLATFGHAGVNRTARPTVGNARKLKARLPGEFLRAGDAVLPRRRQDRLAEGDRLEVVAAGDVWLRAGDHGLEQGPHRQGEGIREPGLRPSGPMPGAPVANGGVLDRAGDPARPAGPADLTEGQSLGPFEAPAHPQARPRPLLRGTRPDVIPTRRPRSVLVLENIQVDPVLVRERAPRVGPCAGEHPDRVAQPVTERVQMVDAHDEG